MSKLERKKRIQRSYRDSVHGTNLRPRLSVFRSNKEIYAQIINDDL
ncbi:MAG: 50S ribosomal protein L18, partial [Bacteroidota bacterium]|nr:50S ribosomal protein L18 [Bacteroidota bacterium]